MTDIPPTPASSESASAQDSAKYGGIPLAEWKRRLADFDVASPQASDAVAPLIEMVGDRTLSEVTRRQAALVLGRMGPAAKHAVPMLAQLVRSPDARHPREAALAAKALSLMGPHAREATPTLIGMLQDEQRASSDRQLALEALAGIGGAHPAAVETLVELVRREPQEDDSAERRQLRVLAVEGLGVMRADAAVATPLLVRILRSQRESEAIRRRAATALGDIGPRAQIAMEPLAETLLADSSEAVRDSAAEALAKLGDAAHMLLVQLIDNEDAGVRWRAAKALGNAKKDRDNVKEISALSGALKDEVAEVRLFAASSLWQQTTDAKAVQPTILELLTVDDRSIRFQAIDLLASLGPQAAGAIEQLKALERDPRDHVRRAATQALRKIQSEKPE